jgi:hypothetical protein
MMQHCNHSDKSQMMQISSDNEGPNMILTVPSTSYQPLANGNFLSSSQMLQVTTALEQPKPTSISIENVVSRDSPFLTDHFPLQVDPAYLKRLNKAFVTVKHPRTYVSVINSLSLIGFECASSRSILSKDGSQNVIHFLLRCCNGKAAAIISQWPALSVGTSKRAATIVSTVCVLDSYAKSVLYFSTGATRFTVSRWVSVLGHHN